MTDLLEMPREMSVADRTFEPKKEVNTVTAAVARYDKSSGVYAASSTRTRPHGLDRALMRVSLATLLWARRHADRTAISYHEHTRLHTETQARQLREREAARLPMRVF